MKLPDFTDWLRDREAAQEGWRPQGLVGAVMMEGTGTLIDWVGQGYGGVHTTELLEAVEKACEKRRYNPVTVLIVARKTGKITEPFDVRNNEIWHQSSDDDQITIYFRPLKDDV